MVYFSYKKRLETIRDDRLVVREVSRARRRHYMITSFVCTYPIQSLVSVDLHRTLQSGHYVADGNAILPGCPITRVQGVSFRSEALCGLVVKLV